MRVLGRADAIGWCIGAREAGGVILLGGVMHLRVPVGCGAHNIPVCAATVLASHFGSAFAHEDSDRATGHTSGAAARVDDRLRDEKFGAGGTRPPATAKSY